MTAPDPTLPREQAVVPPAEIPSGPPVESTADELRRAQQLGRRIRRDRDRQEAWHRCNETVLEQYRREDARVKR